MNKEIIIIFSIIINIIISIIIIIILLHGVTSIKISFYDFLFSNKNEEVYNLCRWSMMKYVQECFRNRSVIFFGGNKLNFTLKQRKV